MDSGDVMRFDVPVLSLSRGTARGFFPSANYDQMTPSKMPSVTVPLDTAGVDRLLGINFSLNREVVYIGQKKKKPMVGLVYPYITTITEENK